MKNKLLYFRFRTWHFCMLLIGLSLFIFLTEPLYYSYKPKQIVDHLYEEIVDELEDIQFGFLLFTGDEPFSDQVEAQLAGMALLNGWDTRLFKVDANEHPTLSTTYNISGTPSIIVLQNGKECCRVLGMVPCNNLQHIYQRFTN